MPGSQGATLKKRGSGVEGSTFEVRGSVTGFSRRESSEKMGNKATYIYSIWADLQ